MYKHAAKRRSLCFDLTRDEFRTLTSADCTYCGVEPAQVRGMQDGRTSASAVAHSEYVHNGVDRVDNALGYTPDNCVPCCSRCNYAKRAMPRGEFENWLMSAKESLQRKDLPSLLKILREAGVASFTYGTISVTFPPQVMGVRLPTSLEDPDAEIAKQELANAMERFKAANVDEEQDKWWSV